MDQERQAVQSPNPYAAPKADVASKAEDFARVRVFSWRGRIGRLRYFNYSFGLPLLFLTIGSIALVLLAQLLGPDIEAPVVILVLVLILVTIILATIRRTRDFNASGWWALLLLVPLTNLAFCFIPGTDGENRFGPQSPPNDVSGSVMAILAFVGFVLILAAVGINLLYGPKPVFEMSR